MLLVHPSWLLLTGNRRAGDVFSYDLDSEDFHLLFAHVGPGAIE
jgi:hypothetical protein